MLRLTQLRWRVILLLATAAALTASFAPFEQYCLAWIALVPWLLVVGSARSVPAAAAWGAIGATVFWFYNTVQDLPITIDTATAMAVQVLSWTLAAAVISAAALMPVNANSHDAAGPGKWLVRVGGIACAWVACEWLRGRFVTELPPLHIGHSQQPFTSVCQIADLGGAYAVSFVVVAVNAAFAATIVDALRKDDRTIHSRSPFPLIAAGLLAVLTCVYGSWQVDDTAKLHDGPTVLVVQTDAYRDLSAFASHQTEYLKLVTELTTAALSERTQAGEPPVDLVVWPLSVGLAGFDRSTLSLIDNELSESMTRSSTALFIPGSSAAGKQRIAGDAALVFQPPAAHSPTHEYTWPVAVVGSSKTADFFITAGDARPSPSNRLSRWTQAAAFRCIERRAPMLRLIDRAGTSLIDSRGHVFDVIPAGENGTYANRLQLDVRSTAYQRYGDWLPAGCAFVSVVYCGNAVRKRIQSHRRHRRQARRL